MTQPAHAYDCIFISTRVSFASEKAYPPIGPGYLSRQLQADGFRSKVVDLQLDPAFSLFSPERLAEHILAADAPVVGLSLFGDMLPTVLIALRSLEGRTDKRILLGGPGVNGSEQDIVDQYPLAWAAVRGEADDIISPLVEAALNGGSFSAPNVVSKTASEPRSLQLHRIRNISVHTAPDAQQLPLGGYDRVSILTSRGCPFNCSFCDIITMWGRKVSYRPTEDVIEELTYLADVLGKRDIDIIDDTFTVDRKRVRELCAGITARDLEIRWTCFSRIDTLDEELVRVMAAAGCTNIYFGIDAGSELRWRKIHKRLNRQKVLDTVRSTLRYTNLTASFIWGYPDESFTEFLDTLTLANEVSAENLTAAHHARVQLHLLSPTRSTPIYQDFSDRLYFDPAAPLDLLGTSLASFDDLPQYHEIVETIRSDAAKFAPYYLYRSDEGAAKAEVMERAHSHLFTATADALLSTDREASLQRDRARASVLASAADPLDRAAGLLLGIWLNCAGIDRARDGAPAQNPLIHLRHAGVLGEALA